MISLEKNALVWDGRKAIIIASSTTSPIKEGAIAYAARQAAVQRGLLLKFRAMWLPKPTETAVDTPQSAPTMTRIVNKLKENANDFALDVRATTANTATSSEHPAAEDIEQARHERPSSGEYESNDESEDDHALTEIEYLYTDDETDGDERLSVDGGAGTDNDCSDSELDIAVGMRYLSDDDDNF